jgi:hypothetical protein
MRFVATKNNRGQATVLLGDLYSVRMKLVQSEIQTSRERIRETGDYSRFIRQTSVWAIPYLKCYQLTTSKQTLKNSFFVL